MVRLRPLFVAGNLHNVCWEKKILFISVTTESLGFFWSFSVFLFLSSSSRCHYWETGRAASNEGSNLFAQTYPSRGREKMYARVALALSLKPKAIVRAVWFAWFALCLSPRSHSATNSIGHTRCGYLGENSAHFWVYVVQCETMVRSLVARKLTQINICKNYSKKNQFCLFGRCLCILSFLSLSRVTLTVNTKMFWPSVLRAICIGIVSHLLSNRRKMRKINEEREETNTKSEREWDKIERSYLSLNKINNWFGLWWIIYYSINFIPLCPKWRIWLSFICWHDTIAYTYPANMIWYKRPELWTTHCYHVCVMWIFNRAKPANSAMMIHHTACRRCATDTYSSRIIYRITKIRRRWKLTILSTKQCIFLHDSMSYLIISDVLSSKRIKKSTFAHTRP